MLSQWGSESSSKVLLALQKAGPVEAVQWHRCNLVRNLQKAIKSSDLPPHASISLFTPGNWDSLSCSSPHFGNFARKGR